MSDQQLINQMLFPSEPKQLNRTSRKPIFTHKNQEPVQLDNRMPMIVGDLSFPPEDFNSSIIKPVVTFSYAKKSTLIDQLNISTDEKEVYDRSVVGSLVMQPRSEELQKLQFTNVDLKRKMFEGKKMAERLREKDGNTEKWEEIIHTLSYL